MIRFILLALLACMIIDGCYSLSDSIEFKRHHENPEALKKAVENVLLTSIKPVKKDINDQCLKRGSVFQTGKRKLLFVKMNCLPGAQREYLGEYESLKAIHDTKTITVPYPVTVGHTSEHNHDFIVLEYMNMTTMHIERFGQLGSQLADLHLKNLQDNNKKTVKQFGFHIETKCGKLLQRNSWHDDWITFFVQNRMEHQIELLNNTKKGSSIKIKIIEEYWPQLKAKIPKFFEGIEVKPSLLHGDLLPANVAEANYRPVIFDSAAFYGHHEYDIALTTLFVGFKNNFFQEYFKKVPRAPGFENRKKLYHLFQLLFSWTQFGNYYRNPVKKTFEQLLEMYK